LSRDINIQTLSGFSFHFFTLEMGDLISDFYRFFQRRFAPLLEE